MPPRKTSRARDLPDQGSFGESIGEVIQSLGGPDIVAGHEVQLREHLKQEALLYTQKRRAARQESEKARGGKPWT